MDARLGIHVIGSRYGESIVLELPDGGVGVIDSFAAHRVPHPVLSFLSSKFPTLSQLRFFGITHPHADHCYRAADILDRYPPEEVWVFLPFPAGQVQSFYSELRRRGTRDAIEEALELPAGSIALSLLQLEERIGDPIRRRTLPYRPFAWNRSFALCGDALHLHFLTPGDVSQYVYRDEVDRAAQAMLTNGPALVRSGRIPQPDHNRASGAVLVEYGKTRALLMSDAENRRWDEWLDTPAPVELCAPVHFIKAAHHGSSNGYLQRFYDVVGDPKTTVAVMTPFSHGSVCLPTAEGVQAVRSHIRNLYCTNRATAIDSTGLAWEAVAAAPLPSLPASWANQIRRSPDLTRLLVPESGVTTTPGASPPLPPQWIIDAQATPALWQLIRPEHRLPIPAPSTVAPHTVSAYYDDKGNLIDFQAGNEVGLLVP